MHRYAAIIFIISGMSSFTISLRNLAIQAEYITTWFGLIVFYFAGMAFTAMLFLFIYGYVFSFFVHKISAWLKGKAEMVDIKITLAFASIPLLLRFLFSVLLINNIIVFESQFLEILTIRIVDGIIILLYFKILFQGISYFSNLNLWKSIISTLPLITFFLGYFVLSLAI